MTLATRAAALAALVAAVLLLLLTSTSATTMTDATTTFSPTTLAPTKKPTNYTGSPSRSPSRQPIVPSATFAPSPAPTYFDSALALSVPPSPWLIAISVIGCVILLGVSIYILIYYQHPDDRNQAYGPKLVVILTLSLCEISVVLLSLDVANRAGAVGCGQWNLFCGGLNLAVAWQAMFGAALIFVGLLIPFSIFFYEAQEEGRSTKSRLCEALQYQGVAIGASIIVLLLTWYNISTFRIPISSIKLTTDVFLSCPDMGGDFSLSQSCATFALNQTITGSPRQVVYVDLLLPNSSFAFELGNLPVQDGNKNFLECPNTFWVFLGAEMAFFGWFLFCIFTGVGLITLPVDLVRKYMHRPKYVPKDIYLKLRDDLHRRIKELNETGKAMKQGRKTYDSQYNNMSYRDRYSKSRDQRTTFKAFKREVEIAEEDFEDLRLCHEAWSSYNPLIAYVKLVLGILSGILSLCWFLQIFLFMLARWPWPNGPPVSYFLNILMTWGLRESGFALIGVFFVALFGLYLFFANVNGNFKVGLRFLVMEIHPMKVGGTYMSSFLVNVLLLLLQMPALLQFLAMSLSEMVALTDIDTIMNQSVRYTSFFKYFFVNNVFVFLLLAFSLLSICLVYAFPSDRDARSAKRLDRKIKFLNEEIDRANLKNARMGRANLRGKDSAFAKAKAEAEAGGGKDDDDDDKSGPKDGGGAGALGQA